MTSRKLLSTNTIGSYSELIAAAAFMAEGCDVAFPMGTQKSWDMVVRYPGSNWLTVQVKTAGFDSGSGYQLRKGAISKQEVDVIVAVHPETGTLWKVVDFPSTDRLHLSEECLWRGVIDYTVLPMTNESKPYCVIRRELLGAERASVKSKLPVDKPEWMIQKTWDSILMWASGSTYDDIAQKHGKSGCAAFDRVRRGLYRLGLGNLPGSLAKKNRH